MEQYRYENKLLISDEDRMTGVSSDDATYNFSMRDLAEYIGQKATPIGSINNYIIDLGSDNRDIVSIINTRMPFIVNAIDVCLLKVKDSSYGEKVYLFTDDAGEYGVGKKQINESSIQLLNYYKNIEIDNAGLWIRATTEAEFYEAASKARLTDTNGKNLYAGIDLCGASITLHTDSGCRIIKNGSITLNGCNFNAKTYERLNLTIIGNGDYGFSGEVFDNCYFAAKMSNTYPAVRGNFQLKFINCEFHNSMGSIRYECATNAYPKSFMEFDSCIIDTGDKGWVRIELNNKTKSTGNPKARLLCNNGLTLDVTDVGTLVNHYEIKNIITTMISKIQLTNSSVFLVSDDNHNGRLATVTMKEIAEFLRTYLLQ